MTFKWKKNFHSEKCIWKCHMQNCHFVPAQIYCIINGHSKIFQVPADQGTRIPRNKYQLTWKRMISMDTRLQYSSIWSTICTLVTHRLMLTLPSIRYLSYYRGPFYQHGLTLISAWKSNYIHSIVLDQITYTFPNFSDYTVEVWEWTNNFHFTRHVMTYSCWD